MHKVAVLVIASVLAAPASALASGSDGTVVSVNARHHTLKLVDRSHHVQKLHYRGHLPKLHRGSRVSYARRGRRLVQIHLHGSSRRTAYVARRTRPGPR